MDTLLTRLGKVLQKQEDLKFAFILLMYPKYISKKTEFQQGSLFRLFGYIQNLPNETLDKLIKWFNQLSNQTLLHFVSVTNSFLNGRIKRSPQMYTDLGIKFGLQFITLLFQSNDINHRIQLSDFYNTTIDSIDLLYDLDLYSSPKKADPFAQKEQFVFCGYPFVISIGAKSGLLELDNARQMEKYFLESVIMTLQGNRAINPFLDMRISRANLIEDSLTQISLKDPYELRKKLRISFENEEGVDAGGLTKEWMLNLIKHVFHSQPKLFTTIAESNYLWVTPKSEADLQDFYLAGIVKKLLIFRLWDWL